MAYTNKKQFMLYVTAQEHARIKQAAESHGKSMNRYILDKALEESQQAPPPQRTGLVPPQPANQVS